MKFMYKYPFTVRESVTLEMGAGAVIRHVDSQRYGEICLWAEVPTTNVTELRKFKVVGTGHLVPENGVYLGTVPDGPYVWHVYEVN